MTTTISSLMGETKMSRYFVSNAVREAGVEIGLGRSHTHLSAHQMTRIKNYLKKVEKNMILSTKAPAKVQVQVRASKPTTKKPVGKVGKAIKVTKATSPKASSVKTNTTKASKTIKASEAKPAKSAVKKPAPAVVKASAKKITKKAMPKFAPASQKAPSVSFPVNLLHDTDGIHNS